MVMMMVMSLWIKAAIYIYSRISSEILVIAMTQKNPLAF